MTRPRFSLGLLFLLGLVLAEAALLGTAYAQEAAQPEGGHEFVFRFSIFVLAIFVGYYVVWSVTPALHTPLMSLTNAISSIILVGAMLAAGAADLDWGGWLGVVAVTLVSINVFGGFLVTQRMLDMFKKKEPKAIAAKE